MYITVNLDNMSVTHKHPNDPWLLADLAWLECGEGGSYSVFPVDNLHALREFTDSDLEAIYCATTGAEQVPNAIKKRSILIRVLLDIFARLPDTECNNFQLQRQCDYAEKQPKHRFQFVGGASTPQKRDNSWQPAPLRIPADPAREAQAVAGTLPLPVITTQPRTAAAKPAATAPQRVQQRPAHNPFAKPPVPAQNAAQRSTGSDSAPCNGPVGDDVWVAAGKPTDKIKILMLRQKIIAALKAQGVPAPEAQVQATNYCANKIKLLAGV